MVKFLATTVACFLTSSIAASAAVVDFDSYSGSAAVSSYSEDGFDFDFGPGSFIFFGTNSNFNGFNSVSMELDNTTVDIVRSDGSLFDFNSVLANQSGTTRPLIFTGVFADNSTIVSSIFAPQASVVDAAVLDFTGFTGIRSLTISSVGNGFGLFDDIVLNPTTMSAVPIPAAGFLLVGALGGLSLIRRRKCKLTL